MMAQDYFRDDPVRAFYNLDGFTSFALTTDVDWAPDFCVDDVLSIVGDAGLNLTVFATHESAPLAAPPAFVEVGIHPDFTRPDPAHGLRRKIPDLLEKYPEARGVRAHRNFFGQNVAQLAAAAGLRYDASVFHWRMPFCQAEIDQFGLVRMAYNWEDGIQADRGLSWSLDHVPFAGPGLKIFNVHPIFVYLNCPNDDYRRSVVKDYSDLTKARIADLQPRIFDGYGARRFFVDLVAALKSSGARSLKLGAVADAARR